MYILFDIGATNMRFARSDDLVSFKNPIIKPNPKKYLDAMVTIKEVINELAGKEEIKAICGGIAGVFDEEKGILLFSPNMTDWVNKPLAKDIFRITGVNPKIFNDAQLSGLGESVFGAGHGKSIVAYITASTGIGGSLTINGKIQNHKYSFEPGHQIIDYKEGTTLHDLAAGRLLEETYGKRPEDLPKSVWEKVAKILAIGLHNSIIHWSPEIVVVGGSLMHKISTEDLRSYLKKSLTMYPEIPEIVCSKLGDLNGLFGAMAFLKRR